MVIPECLGRGASGWLCRRTRPAKKDQTRLAMICPPRYNVRLLGELPPAVREDREMRRRMRFVFARHGNVAWQSSTRPEVLRGTQGGASRRVCDSRVWRTGCPVRSFVQDTD